MEFLRMRSFTPGSHLCFLFALVIFFCLQSRCCLAEAIGGDGPNGHYEGTCSYVPSGPTAAELTVVLTNTSPAANSGYLTAFVFNNPGNKITGVSLTASDLDFSFLGGPDFDGGISGSPFGDFAIRASTSSAFLGGGTPSKGIGVGVTETFTFSLTGTMLD